MEELITKYLTDRLTPAEEERLRAQLSSDEAFRREFELSLAALALTDYSLDDAGKTDCVEKLSELLGR